MRTGSADLLGELLVGGTEIIEQLLIGRGLLQGIELLPVQVLQECIPQHVIVVRLPDDCRDVFKPGSLGCAQTTLSHDELVMCVR